MVDRQDSQQDVVAFLSDPASYPCGDPVERIETHAAILFLVGERAFKLKRAVQYPYLDFSSPTKRKAVCEAELALNRRTAPSLYLGVRAIGRLADGGLAIGRGTPVDWLVVMRRFPQEQLLDTMARVGRLEAKLLRSLADEIARFHAGAEIIAGRAGALMARRVIEGNSKSMAAAARDIFAKSDGVRLARAQRAALDAVASLLDKRAASGYVRHCHGDLHLANICVWRDRPTLFDCLEFDRDLAISDLLYDLAFLLMDLWQRGLYPEASLVFNRYFDRRVETEGVAALPLFLSMRAAVRSHVEASSAVRQTRRQARARHRKAARALLSSAFDFLEVARPRIIAVGGISGSGKSTLAAALAPLVGSAPGARLLRTDILRKRLAGIEPEAHLPRRSYTTEAHATVYAELFAEARKLLVAGWPVIVDAVFDFPETRAGIEHLAEELAVPFHGLWLVAPPALLHARVRARRDDASDAGAAVVDHQLARDVGNLERWRRMDASGNPERTLTLAKHLLKL